MPLNKQNLHLNLQKAPFKQHEVFWQIVSLVPEGKVATYGQIAQLAGHPSHARAVGYALKNLPCDTKIPWHRIVNGKGTISFPAHSVPYERQKQRLETEGVSFINERILLKTFLWQPNLES